MKIGICAVAMMLLTACSRPPGQQVRIATYPILDSFPLYLAHDLGHFQQEGLQIVIEEFGSGTKIMESLVGGSSDVSSDGLVYALIMTAQGRPLKTFFNAHDSTLALLVVAPSKASRIGKVADLKGATVGVAGFGGLQERMLAYYLQRAGLTMADIQLASIGVAGSSVAAIQHGKVDAAMINGSSFALLKRRAPDVRVLIDPRSREQSKELFGVESFPAGLGLIATSPWLTRNPDKARRLARAMNRTLRWIREHSPEEVLDRIPTKLRSDDRTLDMEHLRLVLGLLSKDGRIQPGGPEAVQRVVAASLESAKSIDLASTWTNEFVDANVGQASLPVPLPGLREKRDAPIRELINAGGVTIFANASSAARAGNLLFLSGVIGVKPGTRDLVPGGIGAETRQALESMRTVLRASKATLDDVVKCTVFLTDFAEAPAMNEVYREFFPKERPARSTVQVAGLARGARVEIECIALSR